MSELSPMLLPLDTLAGWPTATDPTALQSLGLLFGLPLLVMIVITLLARAPSLIRSSRGGGTHYTDSEWFGSSPQQELASTASASRPAIGSGSAAEPTPSQGVGGQGVGGASVRW